MIQPDYYLPGNRKDWAELRNHFDAEGYHWNGFMFTKWLDNDQRYQVPRLVMFELNSCQCYVYCYEAPHSETNDLACPRFYRKKVDNWDRLPKDELIELIHQSSKAVTQWEVWMNNYELEQILETL